MTLLVRPWLFVVAGAVVLFAAVADGAKIIVNGVAGPCSPGSFSTTGRMPCTPCPVGTYAAHSLSTRCKVAQAGYYVAAPGMRAQTVCVPGTYSTEGSARCKPCGPTDGCVSLDKRSRKSRPPPAKPLFCSTGSKSCPVFGRWYGEIFVKNFECVDVQHTLESCGGCVNSDSLEGEINSLGGRDCSAIPGIDEVRCLSGRCIIDKCRWGYSLSVDGSHCHTSYGKV